jgi:hypothetical protein
MVRKKTVSQHRNNQEDTLIEKIDMRVARERIFGGLREELYNHLESIKISDLKGSVGKHILFFWADRFFHHVEHNEMDKATLYSERLGPYCIGKVKDEGSGGGKGADMLMEVVAEALSKQLAQGNQPRRIGNKAIDIEPG